MTIYTATQENDDVDEGQARTAARDWGYAMEGDRQEAVRDHRGLMTQAAMHLVPDGATVAVVEGDEEATIAAVTRPSCSPRRRGSQRRRIYDQVPTHRARPRRPAGDHRHISDGWGLRPADPQEPLDVQVQHRGQIAFTTLSTSSDIGDGRDFPRALATAVGRQLDSDISLVTADSQLAQARHAATAPGKTLGSARTG